MIIYTTNTAGKFTSTVPVDVDLSVSSSAKYGPLSEPDSLTEISVTGGDRYLVSATHEFSDGTIPFPMYVGVDDVNDPENILWVLHPHRPIIINVPIEITTLYCAVYWSGFGIADQYINFTKLN